jgi:transcriptional regulator with XRE-family HTH domain
MRDAKRWRPADLARAASTTEGQISRYEAGQRVPTADVLAKLATALEMSADFFLGIDNRFSEAESPRNVAACLTLEWYGRQAEIGRDEYAELLRIARESESPPVSVAAWIMVRDALAIASVPAPRSGDGMMHLRPLGRARRGRHHGPS